MKLRQLLPRPVRSAAHRVRELAMLLKLEHKARSRLRTSGTGRAHSLDTELIVSLTSYPVRFKTLHLTLAALLDQSVKPDRVILWIAYDHLEAIPRDVWKLVRRGLEIRVCQDLRSYKKLVPALEAFPEAFIVTADDDFDFSRGWLETLVECAAPGEVAILCHRGHRATRTDDGQLAPYLEWQFDVQDEGAYRPSQDVMPTTGAGALFPPKCLSAPATDSELFRRLCPDGDDLWFWWCARMAGTPVRKVGGTLDLVPWPGSQATSLWQLNRAGGNDRMIAALCAEFPNVQV
jgi:hypothetical protein